MNSKTKIIVLRAKKLVYTGIFIALGILFLILLFVMLFPRNKEEDKDVNPPEEETLETAYIPGVYATSLTIGGQTLDVEVTVDTGKILDIRMVNLEEAVTTMYPLLKPTFDSLVSQILENQSTENITFAEESRYTTLVLLDAINQSLEKAAVNYDW